MTHRNHPQGTDNALVSLDFDDAEVLSAKTALAFKLNVLSDQRGLSKTDDVVIIGMSRAKVQQVRHYKIQDISLDLLMKALVSLDQHVEIVVRPAQDAHAPGITVAA